MNAVHITDLNVVLGGTTILRDVSISVQKGEWLGIIGPNGAGKSTLLKAIVGLVGHDGAISLQGQEHETLSRTELARTVAYVPQNPVLPPGMTVREYVTLGRSPHLGYFAGESSQGRKLVRDVLTLLEVEELVDRDVFSLSGGEAQRAALGRALVQQAEIVVLDEPTASLDVGGQQSVLGLIDELRTSQNLTVVSTMHDLTSVGQYADRLIMLAGVR